jgi:phosphoribosyl 1,2-cyclic phosphodiesterase
MKLFICSLNSGSNGNCYYVGNDEEAVLIDAGLSCRETEKRLTALGLSITRVKALFVSHEHKDHITGMPVLSRKHQLPVYITNSTLANCPFQIESHLVRTFESDKAVAIGNLAITAFTKSHDACDPHSFIVSGNGVNIGVFTDIGYPSKNVIRYFKLCHAAFLEANYCEDMLATGSYPQSLKRRISGRKGHLSNTQALELFNSHRPAQLSHLILSHLSENNNRPELVDRIFKATAVSTKITVASRYEPTPVFTIHATPVRAPIPNRKHAAKSPAQLSLF